MTNLVAALQAQQQVVQPPREATVIRIDPFYGDEQDPISWIEEFEKAAVVNNYSDARKLDIVQAYLKGTAATWLHERQADANTRPALWQHAPNANQAAIALTFRQPFINHF